MKSRAGGMGDLWTSARQRLSQLDLQEHEDKILLLVALVVSAVVGLTVVAFVSVTEQLGRRLLTAGAAHRLLSPLLGSLAGGWLLYKFFPEARGSGIPQTRVALVLQKGFISLRTVIGKFVCSSISLGSGVALGREGPSVHIGAGIASVAGRRLGLSEEQVRSLIPVGTAAAVAAAFNTPLAAVLFTLEEILSDLHARVVGSVVLGAATSWMVLRLVLGDEPLFHVPAYQLVHPLEFLVYALLGVLGGLVSTAFVKLLLWQRALFLKAPPRWLPFAPACGGLAVGLLALAAPGVLGVGYGLVNDALNGRMALKMMLLLLALKLVATTASYGSGNAGGIFGPSLFIGAMLGGAVGQLAHSFAPDHTGSVGAYALVGMGAAFAGIVRTPMTSVIMIFEVTRDYTIIVPLMIANLCSYALARRLQRAPVYEALSAQDGITMPSASHAAEPLTVESAMRQAPGGAAGQEPPDGPTVHPDDPLDTALQRLGESGREEIRVVSRMGGRPVGTLSFPDALRAYRNLGLSEARRRPGKAARNWLPAVTAAIVAAVLVVSGLLFWQRSRRSDVGAAAFRQGRQLLAQGRVDEAVSTLRRALANRPQDVSIRIELGLALVRSGHFDEAESYLSGAARVLPQSGPLWAGLAETALARGEKAGALRLYAQALSKEWDERDPAARRQARLQYAALLAEAGRRSQAVSALLSLIGETGDDAPAGKKAAEMIQSIGSPAQAEEAYTALAGSFPADASIWARLGEARLAAGRAGPALEAFRRSVALDPSNPEARRSLAVAEDLLAVDPTRPGIPVRERARRWDEVLQRVVTAAAACGSTPEIEQARSWLKRRATSLEISDRKMEAVKAVWQATPAPCKTDAVLAHIMSRLGD